MSRRHESGTVSPSFARSREGDLDAALEAEDRVIELNGSYAPAHWRKGLWLLDRGELEAAQAAFERAIRLDAGDPAADNQDVLHVAQPRSPEKGTSLV